MLILTLNKTDQIQSMSLISRITSSTCLTQIRKLKLNMLMLFAITLIPFFFCFTSWAVSCDCVAFYIIAKDQKIYIIIHAWIAIHFSLQSQFNLIWNILIYLANIDYFILQNNKSIFLNIFISIKFIVFRYNFFSRFVVFQLQFMVNIYLIS